LSGETPACSSLRAFVEFLNLQNSTHSPSRSGIPDFFSLSCLRTLLELQVELSKMSYHEVNRSDVLKADTHETPSCFPDQSLEACVTIASDD